MRIINEYFWGIFLILVGVIFLLKQILKIDIPVFRTIAGILFIYIGLSIMFGGSISGSKSSIVFGNGNIHFTELKNEYNIIFGSGTIDLSDVVISGNEKIKINTIFSTSKIIINKNQPITIKSNAAFASATLPNNLSHYFGNSTYMNNGEIGSGYLEVESNTVFGESRVYEE